MVSCTWQALHRHCQDGKKGEEQQAEIKGTVGFTSGGLGTPRQVTFASLSPLRFLKSGNSNISLAEVLWKFNELISLKVPSVVAGTKERSERMSARCGRGGWGRSRLQKESY